MTHQWEKAVADELNALMHRQQKVVLARLGGPKGRKHTRHWVTDTPLPVHELKALNGKYIVDRNRWIDEVVAAITDIVQAAFAAAGKFIASQFGDDEFGSDDDAAKEVIAQTVRIIAEGFDARTGRLQELIEAGDAAGKNIEDITVDVREAYTQAETWTDVTSRQVVGAMNAAQNIAATDAGAVKKRWLATDDERTRPTHREAEGQVVNIDDKFSVGEGELLFPGDVTGPVGEWINCRCTMLFQTKERDFDAELDEDLADLDAYEATLEGKAVLTRARGGIGAFQALSARFDPRDHPRDYRGRFIDTPDVQLADGSRGIAVAVDKNDVVTVAKPNGDVVEAPAAEVMNDRAVYQVPNERITEDDLISMEDELRAATVEPSPQGTPIEPAGDAARYDVRYEDGEGRVYATVPRADYTGSDGELDPTNPDNVLVGMLRWDLDGDPPRVVDMSVDEAYRRQGIGTRMFETARAKQSDLQHGDVLTDDGRAFAGSPLVSADVAPSSETPVDGKLWLGTDEPDAMKFANRLRRCYELAGKGILNAPEGSTLIHGTIEGFGNPRIGHAWVELPDGSVWEPISRVVYPKDVWEAIASPTVVRRYDGAEARARMLAEEHWGAWHPTDERGNPTDDLITGDVAPDEDAAAQLRRSRFQGRRARTLPSLREPGSEWVPAPNTLPSGLRVGEYGDAVDKHQYNHRLRVFNDDDPVSDPIAELNVAYFKPDDSHTVQWAFTREDSRRTGVMSELMDHYRRYYMEPGDRLGFSVTVSPEGEAFVESMTGDPAPVMEAMPEPFRRTHSGRVEGEPFRVAQYRPGVGSESPNQYFNGQEDLVGFVDAYREDNGNVNIGYLATRPGFEGQGIATRLMEEATRDAPEVDMGEIMHNAAGAITQRMLDEGRTVRYRGSLKWPPDDLVSGDVEPAAPRDVAARTWAETARLNEWETLQPWNATREDVAAGNVPGLRYDRDAVRGFSAYWSADPAEIVVNDSFFGGGGSRALLYHEAGHAIASQLAANHDMAELLAAFRREEGRGFRTPFANTDTGPYLASSVGRGHHADNPTEILADAYMALATGTGGYYDAPGLDELFDDVADAARSLGFPVLPRATKPERETWDNYREVRDGVWERRPQGDDGITITTQGRGKWRWLVYAGERDDGTERTSRGDATTRKKAQEAADAAYERLVTERETLQPGDTFQTHIGPAVVTETGYRVTLDRDGVKVDIDIALPEEDTNRQPGIARMIADDMVSGMAEVALEPGDEPGTATFESGGETYTLQVRDTRRRAHSLPPKVVAQVDGHTIGFMTWHTPESAGNAGEIGSVHVQIPHRRRGVASAMLAFAREQFPEDNIVHSENLSDAGREWATVSPMASRLFESDGGYIDTIRALFGEMLFSLTYDEPEGGEYEVIAEIPAAPKGPIGTFRSTNDLVAASLGPDPKRRLRDAIVTMNQNRVDWSDEMEAEIRKGEPTLEFEWNGDKAVMHVGVDTEHFGWVDSGSTRTFDIPPGVAKGGPIVDFFDQMAQSIGLPYRAYHGGKADNRLLTMRGVDPPARGRTPQAREDARTARRNIATVLALVDEGMSHADAIAEWKRRYRNEKARIKRARDKADQGKATLVRDDLVLKRFDEAVAGDIEKGTGDVNAQIPKAIYSLDAEATTDLIKAGFLPGPGAVTPSGFLETWATAVARLPEGESVPVIGLVHQGQLIKYGRATKLDGMAYLVETSGEGTPEETVYAGTYFARMKLAWDKAKAQTTDEFTAHTKGIAHSKTRLLSDPGGFTQVRATGGDGTITNWATEPTAGVMAHEMAHNIDTFGGETHVDRQSGLASWEAARIMDLKLAQQVLRRDYVVQELDRGDTDHPIDLDAGTGPTPYGASNRTEDFAESVRLYLRDQENRRLGLIFDDRGKGGDEFRFADLWPHRARFLDTVFGNQPADQSPHAVMRVANLVKKRDALPGGWTEAQLRAEMRLHGISDPAGMSRSEMLAVLVRLGVITEEQAA